MTLPIYPQLSSGALSQFPVQKRRKLRTVSNLSEDGRTVLLSDPGGATTEWRLTYSGLTDRELEALSSFFSAAEGTLNSFTFVDPTDNLLASTDDMDSPVWEVGPALTKSKGESDPTGELSAWQIANHGDAAQTLVQPLSVPATYLYCLSAYVKSQTTTAITLVLGSERAVRLVTPSWNRIEFSSRVSGDGAIAFGLEFGARTTFDVYGMQVEPQPWASGFKPTGRGGVYEGARLSEDVLAVTTTGPDCHSCTVNIIHADHL